MGAGLLLCSCFRYVAYLGPGMLVTVPAHQYNTTMKSLLIVGMAFVATGCVTPRSITEQYIKTKIEVHTPGAYSDIRALPIFKSTLTSTNTHYVELTGYKYKGAKGLVIGADRYSKAREKFLGDQTLIAEVSYVTLTETEARKMLGVLTELYTVAKRDKATEFSEVMYRDYTINDRLFVSYKKTSGGTKASLWIDGVSFPVSRYKFLQELEDFLEY